MKTRRLGSTGIKVSEIGFGAWGIGGTNNGALGYGPVDQPEAIRALQRAYERGVTFYDTADRYGYGLSEDLIGQTLGPVRPNITIATKFGRIGPQERQDFSPSNMRTSIEGSLRRLGTDYIDLYQLHSPDIEGLKWDESIRPALVALQKEGKIRAFGISVQSPADGLLAVDRFGAQCIQVNFNMLDMRAMENGLFDLCGQRDVGVIVRTPLCFGFLTVSQPRDLEFHPLDHRGRWSREQIDRWSAAFQEFGPAVADGEGQTQAQIALRFCLSYECVSSVIPGMLTVGHVNDNTSASDMGPLPESEREAFEEAYANNNFFLGNKPGLPNENQIQTDGSPQR